MCKSLSWWFTARGDHLWLHWMTYWVVVSLGYLPTRQGWSQAPLLLLLRWAKVICGNSIVTSKRNLSFLCPHPLKTKKLNWLHGRECWVTSFSLIWSFFSPHLSEYGVIGCASTEAPSNNSLSLIPYPLRLTNVCWVWLI